MEREGYVLLLCFFASIRMIFDDSYDPMLTLLEFCLIGPWYQPLIALFCIKDKIFRRQFSLVQLVSNDLGTCCFGLWRLLS